jgi:hypothetical protein
LRPVQHETGAILDCNAPGVDDAVGCEQLRDSDRLFADRPGSVFARRSDIGRRAVCAVQSLNPSFGCSCPCKPPLLGSGAAALCALSRNKVVVSASRRRDAQMRSPVPRRLASRRRNSCSESAISCAADLWGTTLIIMLRARFCRPKHVQRISGPRAAQSAR